jgi:AraC-like DNA-binding protein
MSARENCIGAREALERDGMSVAQAAYIAGYTSAANFATAFRRFFGTTPENVPRPHLI